MPDQTAADHGVGGLQVGDEHREVAGIALQIAVHRGNDPATRRLETGVERRAQTLVGFEAEQADSRLVAGEMADHVGTSVRRPVVHEDHLGGGGETGQNRGQLLPQKGQVLDLVVHGQDHGEREVGGHGCSAGMATSNCPAPNGARSTIVHVRPLPSRSPGHRRSWTMT